MRCAIKYPSEQTSIDVAVEMPHVLFQEKDFTNNRYLNKRAYYLAMLASAIQSSLLKTTFDAKFEYFNQDTRRPILVLTPVENTKFVIRIIPCIAAETFALGRLAPTRNNLRFRDQDTATPQYNNTLIAEMQYAQNFSLIGSLAQSCPAFVHASVMLRVWLAQRLLQKSQSANGLNAFIGTMLMACLFEAGGVNGRKVLSAQWSSYQIFRVTLEWISKFTGQVPVFMSPKNAPPSEAEGFTCAAFTEAFDVCVVEPSGHYNILGGVSRFAWNQIRQEAAKTVALLSNSSIDCFDQVFLRKSTSPVTKYDHVCTVSTSLIDDGMNDIHCSYEVLSREVCQLLTSALSKRLLRVVAIPNLRDNWTLASSPSLPPRLLKIGLFLNPEHSCDIIDVGPSATDSEAVPQFKKLWGEKAGLRRFKDGTIAESVVWEVSEKCGYDERANIVVAATTYLLERNFNVKVKSFLGPQLFDLVKPLPDISNSNVLLSQPIASHSAVMVAFNEFSKTMRNLGDLPLALISVEASSAALRYASTFIPQPRYQVDINASGATILPYSQPIDVVFQFETSKSWPQQLDAIANMKLALFLKIAECLRDQHPDCVVNIVVPETKDSSSYIEILSGHGYIYRCHIECAQELAELQRQLNDTETSEEDKLSVTSEHERYMTRFVLQPYYSQLMTALVHTYPSLSHTIRVVKRWLSSHWLLSFSESSPSLSDEVAELLCANVYVNCGSKSVPGSTFCGFMRVLELLATFNFKESPLLVPMQEGSYSADKIDTVMKNFDEHRSADPELKSRAMFIAPMVNPNIDDLASIRAEKLFMDSFWTRKSPSAVLIHRLQSLAHAALTKIEKELVQESDVHSCFTHQTSAYDVLITVDPAQCSRRFESRRASVEDFEFHPKFKNLADGYYSAVSFLSMDMFEMFVMEVTKLFDGLGVVLYDRHGGNQVGIVMNPTACYFSKPFKVQYDYPVIAVKNVESTDKKKSTRNACMVHIDDLLKEVRALGNGFIQDVRVGASLQKHMTNQK